MGYIDRKELYYIDSTTKEEKQLVTDGNVPTRVNDVTKMVPTEKQGVATNTINTHNAVSVTNAGSNTSSWYGCDGYDRLCVNVKHDATTDKIQVHVQWSIDGVTLHGYENAVIPLSGSYSAKSAVTEIKAPYFQLVVSNTDTIPHTESVWAYLKA